jgi:hypothetical protein
MSPMEARLDVDGTVTGSPPEAQFDVAHDQEPLDGGASSTQREFMGMSCSSSQDFLDAVIRGGPAVPDRPRPTWETIPDLQKDYDFLQVLFPNSPVQIPSPAFMESFSSCQIQGIIASPAPHGSVVKHLHSGRKSPLPTHDEAQVAEMTDRALADSRVSFNDADPRSRA